MNLDRREVQLFHNRGVLYRESLVDRTSLEPLGRKTGARDRRTAPKCLELCILNYLGFGIDPYLKLHHIATLGGADKPGAYAGVFLVQAPNVARIVVVVNNFI